MEICAFCGAPLPEELVGIIVTVDATCPSDCDQETLIEVTCTECGRVTWSKWIATEYCWDLKMHPAYQLLGYAEAMEKRRQPRAAHEGDWEYHADTKTLYFVGDPAHFVTARIPDLEGRDE